MFQTLRVRGTDPLAPTYMHEVYCRAHVTPRIPSIILYIRIQEVSAINVLLVVQCKIYNNGKTLSLFKL